MVVGRGAGGAGGWRRDRQEHLALSWRRALDGHRPERILARARERAAELDKNVTLLQTDAQDVSPRRREPFSDTHFCAIYSG